MSANEVEAVKTEGQMKVKVESLRGCVFVSELCRIHEGWWIQWVECRVWLFRFLCYSNVDRTLAGTLVDSASSHLISSHLISSHLILSLAPHAPFPERTKRTVYGAVRLTLKVR